jgi:hypothetical protein
MPNIKLSSLNKGLVGHWTMAQDSLKGSLLADKTPYENDGTIYGATFTTDRKGQANKAMSFNGSNNYIDCGNNSSLDITDEITISAWIKYDGNDNETIVQKNGSNYYSGDYNLRMYGNGLSFGLMIEGVFMGARTNSLPTAGVWHHCLGTYNGNVMRVYLDMLPGNNLITSGTIDSSPDEHLFIGKRIISPYMFFNGLIDDVRIYNRALSEEEITLLYNSYNPKIVMKTSLPKIKLYGGDY